MTFRYTEKHLAFLRATQAQSRRHQAELFNAQFGTNKTASQIHGLCKRKRILTGRTGQFQPGVPSWSAGTKGLLPGSATSFKKGNRPPNYCPLGAERLTSRDLYVKVKVGEPNRWRFKHLLVWEAHHGPVPRGHAVIFLDGNRSNVTIENLELISRRELLYLNRNGFADVPGDIRPTAIAIARVAVRTFERGAKL
jgi:hypothetical protein